MTHPISSFGFSSYSPKRERSEIQAGELVTVELFSSDGPVKSGARVREIRAGNVWVTLAGLVVPQPYEIGMALVIDLEKVIDWD